MAGVLFRSVIRPSPWVYRSAMGLYAFMYLVGLVLAMSGAGRDRSVHDLEVMFNLPQMQATERDVHSFYIVLVLSPLALSLGLVAASLRRHPIKRPASELACAIMTTIVTGNAGVAFRFLPVFPGADKGSAGVEYGEWLVSLACEQLVLCMFGPFGGWSKRRQFRIQFASLCFMLVGYTTQLHSNQTIRVLCGALSWMCGLYSVVDGSLFVLGVSPSRACYRQCMRRCRPCGKRRTAEQHGSLAVLELPRVAGIGTSVASSVAEEDRMSESQAAGGKRASSTSGDTEHGSRQFAARSARQANASPRAQRRRRHRVLLPYKTARAVLAFYILFRVAQSVIFFFHESKGGVSTDVSIQRTYLLGFVTTYVVVPLSMLHLVLLWADKYEIKRLARAKTRASKAKLEARHMVVRWVCHEVRVPLNTVVLGMHDNREVLQQVIDRCSDLADGVVRGELSGEELRQEVRALLDDDRGLRSQGKESDDVFRVMKRATDQMQHILNDVLTMEKIEQGKLQMEPSVFNASRLVRDVQHCFAQRARASGAELASKLCGEAAITQSPILGAEGRLNQVLSNFVTNAIKASRPGTAICVRFSVTLIDHAGRVAPQQTPAGGRSRGLAQDSDSDESVAGVGVRKRTGRGSAATQQASRRVPHVHESSRAAAATPTGSRRQLQTRTPQLYRGSRQALGRTVSGLPVRRTPQRAVEMGSSSSLAEPQLEELTESMFAHNEARTALRREAQHTRSPIVCTEMAAEEEKEERRTAAELHHLPDLAGSPHQLQQPRRDVTSAGPGEEKPGAPCLPLPVATAAAQDSQDPGAGAAGAAVEVADSASAISEELPFGGGMIRTVEKWLSSLWSKDVGWTGESLSSALETVGNLFGPAKLGVLCCSVSDDGVGIAVSDQRKLFQPFYQIKGGVGSSGTGSTAGTGLGLGICKSIVNLHRGRVGFYSPGRRKGAEFWFAVPVFVLERRFVEDELQVRTSTPVPTAASIVRGEAAGTIPIHWGSSRRSSSSYSRSCGSGLTDGGGGGVGSTYTGISSGADGGVAGDCNADNGTRNQGGRSKGAGGARAGLLEPEGSGDSTTLHLDPVPVGPGVGNHDAAGALGAPGAMEMRLPTGSSRATRAVARVKSVGKEEGLQRGRNPAPTLPLLSTDTSLLPALPPHLMQATKSWTAGGGSPDSDATSPLGLCALPKGMVPGIAAGGLGRGAPPLPPMPLLGGGRQPELLPIPSAAALQPLPLFGGAVGAGPGQAPPPPPTCEAEAAQPSPSPPVAEDSPASTGGTGGRSAPWQSRWQRERAGPFRGMRIMVVDDVEGNRLLLSRQLRNMGASEIVTATDGLSAIKLLCERAVFTDETCTVVQELCLDVVFLDKEMPLFDGYQFLDALREGSYEFGYEATEVPAGLTELQLSCVLQWAWHNIPVIGCTGNALPEDRAEFVSKGVSFLLLKPVRPDAIRKLGQFMEGRAPVALVRELAPEGVTRMALS